jgi:hypothetical protein
LLELRRGLEFGVGLTRILLLSTSLLLLGSACHAAELSCPEPRPVIDGVRTCPILLVKGEIQAGDSKKFSEALRANYPSVFGVQLWSSGGSIDEALKIGRLVRKAMLTTRAPSFWGDSAYLHPGTGMLFGGVSADFACKGKSCHCASACFLIWAGGVKREGDVLGVHRPRFDSPEFAKLPVAEATAAYKSVLAETVKYLFEMEVAPQYIAMMSDTSSVDIQWLNIGPSPVVSEVPSIEEWIRASCGLPSSAETDEVGRILEKMGTKQPVSAAEQTLVDGWRAQLACESRKIEEARRAIGVDELD